MVRYKEKCFRCGVRSKAGLHLTMKKRGSDIGVVTHPICESCALSFWRWADEVRTVMTYSEARALKDKFEAKMRELRKRERAIRRREKALNRDNEEVVGGVR